MQIPLMKGDVIKNVEYRDALPTNMIVIPRQIFDANGYMFQWYGLTEFANGEGIDRGAIWVSRTGLEGHYRLSGTSFIKVNTNGTTEVLGTINGTDEASLAYSFNNIAIVADNKLYYYNPTDGFRQITSSGVVGSPIDIAWIDNYFVLTDGEGVYHSNIADEKIYDPLDFGNAQFRPDPAKGIAINEDNELVVFGAFTVEYFTNTANENFVFTRIQRKAQKIGIIGTHCKREMNGKWYTLARRKETSPSFHIISLGSEQKFSTREIDKILSTYTETELELTTIDTFVIDNIKMVQFNLPRETLLFNETAAETVGAGGAWVILKSDVNGDRPFRGKGAIYDPYLSEWIVGDKYNSNIGTLDESAATHYGELAEFIMFTPFIKLDDLSIDELNIETIPGIAPDNDATVAFSVTYDGRNYSKEWWNLYGENLDYNQRFYIRRIGYVRNWVSMKFRGASRSRMSFSRLDIEVS
jgi:hypothetical protein